MSLIVNITIHWNFCKINAWILWIFKVNSFSKLICCSNKEKDNSLFSNFKQRRCDYLAFHQELGSLCQYCPRGRGRRSGEEEQMWGNNSSSDVFQSRAELCQSSPQLCQCQLCLHAPPHSYLQLGSLISSRWATLTETMTLD